MLKNKIICGKKINFLFFFPVFFLIANCSKDDAPPPTPTGQSKQYIIFNTNLSDITGTVDFIENTNGSTTISLKLNNSIEGYNNPVRLRRKTANIGGGIAVNLKSLNGENGISNTTLTKLENGESISYDQLAEFNGYIAIEGENENEGALLAYTDLGPNELTGEKVTYNLYSPDGDFNGLATIEERKKGTAALMIGLLETDTESELPCALYILQESSDEEYVHQLSPITSESKGFSFNELTEIDGVATTYKEILELDAYIEVSDPIKTTSFKAKGAIGSYTD